MGQDNSNFAFLRNEEAQLFRLGLLAESYFAEDPNTSLFKLRQLAEAIAKLSASRYGSTVTSADTFNDVLRTLRFDCALPRDVSDLFHAIRLAGNEAVHENTGTHQDALHALKTARQLAAWYYRAFHQHDLKTGPFVPPRKPEDGTEKLKSEIERLKSELHRSIFWMLSDHAGEKVGALRGFAFTL